MLSQDSLLRLLSALTENSSANEVASDINNGNSLAQQSKWSHPAVIIATHASATTDFSALAVGDIVIHIAAGAFGANHVGFASVITAGTNPDGAGVIGDLYVAMRSFSLPAATNIIY